MADEIIITPREKRRAKLRGVADTIRSNWTAEQREKFEVTVLGDRLVIARKPIQE